MRDLESALGIAILSGRYPSTSRLLGMGLIPRVPHFLFADFDVV